MHNSVKPEDIVVFIIQKESECSECGDRLQRGSFFKLENKNALCLSCADLDHLEYLHRGDAALTRRSSKHSCLHAKVVKWNRRRKRYERQGVLVETEALQQAEDECLADEDIRSKRRERDAGRRVKLDEKYLKDFTGHILKLLPLCPAEAAMKIARHACLKNSGRVGRSASAKEFASKFVLLAVRAHIRHCFTRYDALLAKGWSRHDARNMIQDDVDQVIHKWQGDV